MTVLFTDRSMGTPLAWQGDFGDGSNSTDQNPEHTYTGTGTYTVTLKVQNHGGSSTDSSFVWVRGAAAIYNPVKASPTGTPTPTGMQSPPVPARPGMAPISFFAMSRSMGVAPLTVSFTDMSFNAPESWEWDFCDGETSNIRNPTHVHDAGGIHSLPHGRELRGEEHRLAPCVREVKGCIPLFFQRVSAGCPGI